jgi:hypothetical protein
MPVTWREAPAACTPGQRPSPRRAVRHRLSVISGAAIMALSYVGHEAAIDLSRVAGSSPRAGSMRAHVQDLKRHTCRQERTGASHHPPKD